MRFFPGRHPAVLLLYFAVVITTAMFLRNPVSQLCVFAGAAVLYVLIKKKRVLRDALFYAILFIAVTITNPIFSHNGNTEIFSIAGIPFTLESFAYGASIAVMLISVMMWCKVFNECITEDKILYLFGKKTPSLALIISMSIKFIPLFIRKYKEISGIQKTMGLSLSQTRSESIRAAIGTFTVFLSREFENALETATSMNARGYGLKKKSTFSVFRFTATDISLLSVILILSIMLFLGTAFQENEFMYYPAITPVDFSFFASLSYVACLALSFLPFIIETGENIKWRYFISKI